MFKNKRFIFVLGLLLFVGASGIWVYNKFSLNNPNNIDLSDEGAGINFSSEEQTADYIGANQQVDIPDGVGNGDKIFVQGSSGTIELKNFYKEALAILEESQVVIYRGDKFDVDYLRTSSEFVITINTSPAKENIDEAGEYLIEKLGIRGGDLCKLKFIIVLSEKLNSSEQYRTLPLCSSVLK